MSDEEECTDADDVVEEVREARRRIWARCDNDPEKYMAYTREFGIRVVRAGWPEAPPLPPRDGQCTGSADEDRTTGTARADEENAAERDREARRREWERFINQPGKLLALLRDIEAQLVREGFIKPDARSPGQRKSAA
jgi:hypothetical protein